jgi:hypothetical protein
VGATLFALPLSTFLPVLTQQTILAASPSPRLPVCRSLSPLVDPRDSFVFWKGLEEWLAVRLGGSYLGGRPGPDTHRLGPN